MTNMPIQTLINDVTAQDVINASAGMPKRQQNAHLAEELYLDIISYMSVLYKMGFDNCVDNESLFVEMLNEAQFRTVQGHEFSLMSYRKFMDRMNVTVKTAVSNAIKDEL